MLWSCLDTPLMRVLKSYEKVEIELGSDCLVPVRDAQWRLINNRLTLSVCVPNRWSVEDRNFH